MSDFPPPMPLIRRMMPRLMAEDIIGVQPIGQGHTPPMIAPSEDHRTETEKYLERIGIE